MVSIKILLTQELWTVMQYLHVLLSIFSHACGEYDTVCVMVMQQIVIP